MKQKLLQSWPYIIVALIMYFVLLFIFHKEYVYLYTEWFIDEWVIITIITPIYIALVFALYLAFRYITANENRMKKIALVCLVIGVIAAIIAGMKMYVDYEDAEYQKQLDIANDAAEVIKQQQKQTEQEYWKIYKETIKERQN